MMRCVENARVRAVVRTALKGVLALAVLVVPSSAFAQGSLTGTVRDATGAVVPGVVVQAASDALIDRVRTTARKQITTYRAKDRSMMCRLVIPPAGPARRCLR